MEQINLLKVGNSAKSKHELYRLLTVEGGMYLPPEKETGMDFISEISIGDKKVSVYLLHLPDITNLDPLQQRRRSLFCPFC